MFGRVDPRRIPFVGNDIYQVGQVYNITSQACGPDPWIAVQAAWSYTPMLLWSLVKPDFGDLTFSRGGRPHTRKRFRRMRWTGAMEAPPPRSPGVSMALFSGYQVLQRLGWWLIVVDATTDFAVNWTSMAYAWSGCDVPGVPYASLKGAGGYAGGSLGERTATWHGSEYDWRSPGYVNQTHAAIHAPGPKTCSAAVTVETEPYGGGQGRIISADLVAIQNNRVVRRNPMSVSGGGPGMSHLSGADSWTFADAPSTSWRVDLTLEAGELTFGEGTLSATGAPPSGLEHDP